MRFTVDLGKLYDSKLTELSERDGTTKADVLKRAIAIYSYMRNKVDEEDHELYLRDKTTGQTKEFCLHL
jgi:hypothetical protein